MRLIRRLKSKLNVNIPLSKNAKLYMGINKKIGPYTGINYKPTPRVKINPRINARYGPSANAQYKIYRRVTASASVTPTNADTNITARISRNSSASVGIDRLGAYSQLRHKRLILRSNFKK